MFNWIKQFLGNRSENTVTVVEEDLTPKEQVIDMFNYLLENAEIHAANGGTFPIAALSLHSSTYLFDIDMIKVHGTTQYRLQIKCHNAKMIAFFDSEDNELIELGLFHPKATRDEIVTSKVQDIHSDAWGGIKRLMWEYFGLSLRRKVEFRTGFNDFEKAVRRLVD